MNREQVAGLFTLAVIAGLLGGISMVSFIRGNNQGGGFVRASDLVFLGMLFVALVSAVIAFAFRKSSITGEQKHRARMVNLALATMWAAFLIVMFLGGGFARA